LSSKTAKIIGIPQGLISIRPGKSHIDPSKRETVEVVEGKDKILFIKRTGKK